MTSKEREEKKPGRFMLIEGLERKRGKNAEELNADLNLGGIRIRRENEKESLETSFSTIYYELNLDIYFFKGFSA